MGETATLETHRIASTNLHDDAARTELNGSIETGRLTGTELHAIETKCYAELHSLRDELDLLVNELQNFLARMNTAPRLRQAA